MSEIVESTLKTADRHCRCSSNEVVKAELASIGVSPVVVELDQDPDGRENQTTLIQTTGQEQTVPSVSSWVDGKHIGGTTSENVPRGVMFRESAKMRAVRQHAEMAGLRHWYLIA